MSVILGSGDIYAGEVSYTNNLNINPGTFLGLQ